MQSDTAMRSKNNFFQKTDTCNYLLYSGDAVMLIYEKTPHLFSDEEHFLEMEVDFLQPFLDIEARTALANPGKVAMT